MLTFRSRCHRRILYLVLTNQAVDGDAIYFGQQGTLLYIRYCLSALPFSICLTGNIYLFSNFLLRKTFQFSQHDQILFQQIKILISAMY